MPSTGCICAGSGRSSPWCCSTWRRGLGVFASAVALQIWGNWPNVVFAGVFFFWLTMQGIQLAIKPPRLFSLIFCLDASLLALVLFVGYASAVGVSLMWAMPIMAGCAASILGVICQRIGSQMTGRSWAMVLAAFAAIFLLVWLLVSFVAAPAGGGLVTVWNAITGLIGFLGSQVWRLLCWIASLFPEPGDNGNLEDLQANPEDYLPEEQPLEAENPVISAILAMMTIAAVILLAVWLVRQLLKIRIGGIRRQEVENTGPPAAAHLPVGGAENALLPLGRLAAAAAAAPPPAGPTGRVILSVGLPLPHRPLAQAPLGNATGIPHPAAKLRRGQRPLKQRPGAAAPAGG